MILVPRQGMYHPGAQEPVVELAKLAAGAEFTVVACDVADLDSLESIMAILTVKRPLRGVIHAAGAQDNGIISTLTLYRCIINFAPRVNGAWYLHQLTRNMDIDLLVMFSTISGVVGMSEHGNYAVANAFLDALIAHSRHAQGLSATSITYGTWEGNGMAVEIIIGTNLTRFIQSGLDLLKPEGGLEISEQAVHSGRPLTVVAALDARYSRSY